MLMTKGVDLQDLERLVGPLVEQALAKMLDQKTPEEKHQLEERNQQKRLELLDRVIRLEERTIRLEEGHRHLQEGQKQLQEGQKAIILEVNRRFTEMREDTDKRFTEMQEGQKALILEMNRRFTEMREDTDKRFTEMNRRFQSVQWLIVAMGGFLGLVMTLLRLF